MRCSLNKIPVLVCLLLLSACSLLNRNQNNSGDRYTYLVDMLKEHSTYAHSSQYFDIDVEMARIEDGYRYYVIIDKPTLAMYDIEVLAIEPDGDYQNNMAANVGIFEEEEYHMIPNQSNVQEGYVKGVIASGLTQNPEITLHIFVQFKNADYSTVHTEYLELTAAYEG